MAVGVGIGILGQYVHEHELKNNLYDIPLSPFTIGFATIGPILSIGTTFKYGIKLSGSIHARADVKFENSRFSYDFATKKFAQENFFPKSITPGLSADAGIELTAGFGVPVGLELALTVGPCAICKGSVGIITQPTLEINATMAAEAKLIDQTGSKKIDVGIKSIDGCKGISVALTARNYLFGSIKSFKIIKDLDKIFHTSPALNLHKQCIKLGAQPPKTSKRTLPAASYNGASQVEARQIANATSSTNSTSKTYDLTEFIVDPDEDMEYVEYYNADVPYNYDNDEEYWIGNIELSGSNGTVIFASCNDGNVYMQTAETYYDLSYYQSCTSLWAGFEDVVVSSPNGEFLHYYNNTMSKVGVSRLRSAPANEIPETSVYVALAPFAYDTGSTILAAFDTNDNIFFPVICTYAGSQGAKIYLVNEDIDAGIKMLKSPDLTYSVTNGPVKDCQVLFLAISDRPDDSWSAYESDVSDAYEADPLALAFNSTMLDSSGEVNEDLLLAVDDEDLDFTDVWDDEYWLDLIDDLFDDDDNSTSVLRR
ncbi:hypothetical protein FB567DRAFT_534009 [Paraphoma chrysanthemicola]|uniref:Uncharacterized protein n=1 Tax=Paraphoma chrysanthemicola TaxID=798071 RepID=A0A8K0VUY6_9PLEO|nr:hypothetical protein FB567DRAFT_534009 [Paraphoma chrysanthemicola]